MLLKDVWIDAPHRHRRLTLFRLMDPEGRTLPYRLMSEALEGGASFSRRTGVRSDTGALDDLYGARRDEIEKGARGFPLRVGQVGTLAAVGDRVVGAHRAGTPPEGRGTYRTLSGSVVGGELTDGTGDVRDGERLVHLSGFPERR